MSFGSKPKTPEVKSTPKSPTVSDKSVEARKSTRTVRDRKRGRKANVLTRRSTSVVPLLGRVGGGNNFA